MPVPLPRLLFESQSVRFRYLLAVLACVLALGVALSLRDVLDLANAVMIFLLAVVLVASRLGRGPAVVASLVCVALFDFFFVPPRFSLAISHGQYLVTFLVMLAVSLLIGQLHRLASVGRLSTRAAGERSNRALYDLAKRLAGARQPGEVDRALRDFIGKQLGAGAWLLLPDADGVPQAESLAAGRTRHAGHADRPHWCSTAAASSNRGRPSGPAGAAISSRWPEPARCAAC